jgi:DNA mismatch endonuclease (patch repair protein)
MMAGIRRRDTRNELAVRRALHARGFRYRLDVRTLPGRPDVVLPRWNAIILVHGCFWHSHDCGLCRIPATRPDFWREKLDRNASRDQHNVAMLLEGGWRVATVWECALRGRGQAAVEEAARKLAAWLPSSETRLELRG